MPKAGSQASAKDLPPIKVHVNSRSSNALLAYPTNYISTTKYTLATFLPHNLFLQFQKASNCFFFLNMVIALIPGVSPVFPATTILPLVVVLAVAAIRDAFEDFGRYQSDRKANATPVDMIPEGGSTAVVTKESRDVLAGDILYLKRGAEIPADCIIMSTALEDGACFVETANLDGETNLKPKQAKLALQRKFGTVASIAQLSGEVTCDAPSNSLTSWQGKVAVPGCGELSLDMDSLLLRGCVVRNVDWVITCVVYTGVNTKMFLNLTQKPPKVSRLDTKLNRLIALILVFQQVLIIVICSMSADFSTGSHYDSFYLHPILAEWNGGMWFVLTYLTYFVLLAFMMPISLFVSLEFCKTAQAKFMEWDDQMSHNGRRMVARTSSLNEELSQVQYVFSDKTGTLTENQMRFARAFAGGRAFDELKHPGGLAKFLAANPDQQKMQPSTIFNFLRLLSLNNAIVINIDASGQPQYDGSSTDEVALVGTARDNGFRLLSRNSETMTVEIDRQPTVFRILDTLPFTAERKMMSVAVQEKNGDIRLYTKGADSSVMSRVSESNSDPKLMKNAQQFLDSCAEEGLRTLAVAERLFVGDEYAVWKKKWDQACLTVTSDRADLVHAAALDAEANLTFVGCTAIEDRLQDEVPETIHFLLRCGIVVWVLTGDKRETAVNIAKTSKLMNPTLDHIMQIYATGVPVGTQIDNFAREAREAKSKGQKTSFVVDGAALEKILEDKKNYVAFRELGLLVNSAVCCRVTPLQKASVVAMFQELGNTCLGVGDGANDVSMIQEARVGIGIMGLEGSQAERAADYALPRFRHLRRLIAVHGRYSLIRNSALVQYSFYKNLVYSLVQVYYCFYNGYSGQTVFDSWVLIFFNMAFTFLPPMVMGMFDFDVRDKFLMAHPGLYNELRSPFAVRMSRVSSFIWLMMALWHSWLIFYGVYNTNFQLQSRWDGKDTGMWFDGTTLCNTLLFVVNAQAALVFLSWTWIHVASIVLSFVAYYAFIFIYAAVPPSLSGIESYYGVPAAVLSDPSSWFAFFLWFFALAVPQIILVATRRRYFSIRMHDARAADYERKKHLPWADADETSPRGSPTADPQKLEMRLIERRSAESPGPGPEARAQQHHAPSRPNLDTRTTESDELSALDRVL
jgi:phospholipid-transporting ATPase